MVFQIEFSEPALDHLSKLDAARRSRLLDAIEEQLVHQPTMETHRRKKMRPNPLAPWELRVGDMRVYYEVSQGTHALVSVVAVGVKSGSELRIGGEVVHL